MATAILVAAGRGSRLGEAKPFADLGGRPLLHHALRPFLELQSVASIILVIPRGADSLCRSQVLPGLPDSKPIVLIAGGETRQDSVALGLEQVRETGLVVIHDGARPFAPPQLIQAVLTAATSSGAAAAGLPLAETVKAVTDAQVILRTVDRTGLWAAQTPQAFSTTLLREAYAAARRDGVTATDDAALVERLGHPVTIVPGSPLNMKVTWPEDLVLARRLAGVGVRVGLGYDVHPFTPGRRLVLGGVEIPSARGLAGHSDADVLLHAISDALLGAAALGDMGTHFPSDDPQYAGCSSLVLLERVGALLKGRGYAVVHLDGTLLAERPKIAPYISVMRERIAGALGISPETISIKATTTEGLGFIGRGEGMAAQAVATLTTP